MRSANPRQLNCMIYEVSKSTCQLSDFYCISRNQELNDHMTTCVTANCTIREALGMCSYGNQRTLLLTIISHKEFH